MSGLSYAELKWRLPYWVVDPRSGDGCNGFFMRLDPEHREVLIYEKVQVCGVDKEIDVAVSDLDADGRVEDPLFSLGFELLRASPWLGRVLAEDQGVEGVGRAVPPPSELRAFSRRVGGLVDRAEVDWSDPRFSVWLETNRKYFDLVVTDPREADGSRVVCTLSCDGWDEDGVQLNARDEEPRLELLRLLIEHAPALRDAVGRRGGRSE